MMKTLKYILSIIVLITAVWGCEEENFDNLDFVNSIAVPTNVSALFGVTQDNTGLVTITPNSEGAVSYTIYYGDETAELETVTQGESSTHTYAEGSYTVRIVASGISGRTSEITLPLSVSFNSPSNLQVAITNDDAISKQVNVTATADDAVNFQVDFGDGSELVEANIGEVASYAYADAGLYTIIVTAMGAAIETESYTEVDFEVTAILQPVSSAPTPSFINAEDVISIFSSVYTDVSDTNYFPDWGQAGQGSSWSLFDLSGDEMLQYVNLSYQGIALAEGTSVDVSTMEYLHLDVWTADAVTDLEVSLINDDAGVTTEAPVTVSLTPNAWTSIEIPISEYTDQGLAVDGIFQLKLVGTPWAAGTVFVDNVYFYRESTTTDDSGYLPLDFELDYSLSSFDGGAISLVENPDTNGNTSSNVLELIKDAGQVWAGSKITVNTPFSIEESITVTAKVWSPRVGLNLLMKFEDNEAWPNTSATAEITAVTTVANQWEELTFVLTGVDSALDYSNLVLIMDNGTSGDGSSDYTIYVDDISVESFFDFEANYSLSSFDGGAASVIDNPDTSGNTSSNVLELIKDAGQVWAGSKITVDESFAIEESTTITAKVWSPRAGLNLLIKFEDNVAWPNTSATAEITAITTVANQWEELTFVITGVDSSLDYNNLVLIMDNGTAGDGSSDYTIYVDDISKN